MTPICTRKQSIALGLPNYFTGLPCKNGHIAERNCRKCECLECKAVQSKQWDKSNPELVSRRRKSYRVKHSKTIKQRQQKYYSDNRSAFVQRARDREIAKLQRTPSWANKEAIEFFYKYRPHGCHVDHVIPLQGKLVSGLHVETNLQWLPAKANLSKGNKFDMAQLVP